MYSFFLNSSFSDRLLKLSNSAERSVGFLGDKLALALAGHVAGAEFLCGLMPGFVHAGRGLLGSICCAHGSRGCRGMYLGILLVDAVRPTCSPRSTCSKAIRAVAEVAVCAVQDANNM